MKHALLFLVTIALAGCGAGSIVRPNVVCKPGASWSALSSEETEAIWRIANAPGGAEWITDEEMGE